MMTDTQPNSGQLKATFASAFLALFFIQLVTIWMESIYRLSLIKLHPEQELLGLLFILLPLVVLLVPKKAQGWLLVSSLVVLLAARAACPFFGSVGRVIVAGAGVGAFLVVACFLSSPRWKASRGSFGQGVALAVLISVMLRAWGSSFDVSMGMSKVLLPLALVAMAAFQLRGFMSPPRNAEEPPVTVTMLGRLARSMLLFSSLAIVYLVLSSPAVVAAWSGSSYFVGTIVLTACFAAALAWLSGWLPWARPLSRGLLLGWNVAFAVALLLGIALHTVRFPSSPDAGALIVEPTSWARHLPLYLMFAMSPVVIFNIVAAVDKAPTDSPRAQVLPITLGMAFLTTVTLLLVFTNTWGYMGPVIRGLRNKFYLPFLIASLGMTLPLLLPVWRGAFPLSAGGPRSKLPAATIPIWVALFIAGGAFRGMTSPDPPGDTDTLTVLTYNIQQGTDVDGNRSLHRQLEFIRKIDPDIIGLQESDSTRPSLGNIDTPRFFAVHLGYHMYWGPTAVTGTYGTAILSRFPLENPRTFFTYSTIDEVGTAVAEIEVDGRRIGVFNSHPAGPPEVMQAHAEALVKECAQYDYVIAVGDYNTRPTAPTYPVLTAALSESWLQVHPDGAGEPHPLWPESRPETRGDDVTRRIDYVFVSPNIEAVESYYLYPPESETDHPAHWSVLRLK